MKKTVLVVEDDFDTVYPLSELLKLKGYIPATAFDAEAALALARANRPKLILTDIALAGKNGLQLISGVRRDDSIRDTPIIVISGCGPMMMVEAESIGANLCLPKPIDLPVLWAAIESVFDGYEQQEREQGKAHPDKKAAASAAAGVAKDPDGAKEIDQLIQRLQEAASRDERADYIKRLKEQVFKLDRMANGGA